MVWQRISSAPLGWRLVVWWRPSNKCQKLFFVLSFTQTVKSIDGSWDLPFGSNGCLHNCWMANLRIAHLWIGSRLAIPGWSILSRNCQKLEKVDSCQCRYYKHTQVHTCLPPGLNRSTSVLFWSINSLLLEHRLSFINPVLIKAFLTSSTHLICDGLSAFGSENSGKFGKSIEDDFLTGMSKWCKLGASLCNFKSSDHHYDNNHSEL